MPRKGKRSGRASQASPPSPPSPPPPPFGAEISCPHRFASEADLARFQQWEKDQVASLSSPAAQAAVKRERKLLQQAAQEYRRLVEAGLPEAAAEETARREMAKWEARRRRRRRADKLRAKRKAAKVVGNERKATKRNPAKRQRKQRSDIALSPEEITDGKEQVKIFVKQQAQDVPIKKEAVLNHLTIWFRDKKGKKVSRGIMQRDIIWPVLGRASRAH
jgi:hypothetical protein